MKSIEAKCEFCNALFLKTLSEYNRCSKLNLKHFCSLSCSAKFSGVVRKQKFDLIKQEYYKNPKKCKNCELAIDFNSKNSNEFCGSSCAAKFNNSNRSFKKECLNCGSLTKNNKFCRVECFFSHKKKTNAKLLESGQKAKDKTYKSYLIDKNGNKCQMCSFSEWGNKPILLILDHIDGNSENCSLQNLRLICSNCDTLTPTYKGRNRGNGRFFRRQRYGQGKSY